MSMSTKPDQPAGDGGQVFELTMDNPEDQEELNARLRKPGESESDMVPKNGHAAQPELGAEADLSRHPGL